MKSQKKLRVAVIGIGAMGKNHARVYSEMKDAELVGVVDTNLALGSEIAKAYSTKAFGSVDELLKDGPIDAASVCVPTHLHEKIALPLIKKKINLLIEKPIAQDEASAKRLIELSKKEKTILSIGHIERFNPAIVELKKRIRKGELGKIFLISAQRHSPFPKRILDVGVGIDLAVHDLDVMSYLLDQKITEVHSYCAKKIHSSNEDLLIGSLQFSNGTIGQISCNWITPKIVRELVVIGEKGMFTANYLIQELVFNKNAQADEAVNWEKGVSGVIAGEATIIPITKKEPLREELENFFEAVRKGEGEIVSGEDGLSALRVSLALLESSKKNQSVKL